MNTKHTLLVSLAVAVLAAGLYSYLKQTTPAPPNESDAATAKQRTSSESSTSQRSSSGEAKQIFQAGTSIPEGLYSKGQRSLALLELANSNDYRKTYDSFRAQAASDANLAFQLGIILKNCSFLLAGGRSKSEERLMNRKFSPEIDARRIRVFSEQAAKCQGFQDETWNQAEREALRKAAESGSHAKASDLAQRSSTSKAVDLSVVKDLVASADPITMMELVPLLTNQAMTTKPQALDVSNVNRLVVSTAFELAACDLGFPCDQLFTPAFCMQDGICNQVSFATALQSGTLTPAQFEAVVRLKDRILFQVRQPSLSGLGL